MIFGWPIAPDNDLYFHLKCGQLIEQRGHLLRTDPFTFTAAGSPDESPHSWLSQLIFWKVYQRFGLMGLQILNFLLVAAMLSFIWAFVWKRTQNSCYSFLITTLALLVHHHVQILRPILFTECLLILVLFVLLKGLESLNLRTLSLLSLVSLLWANLHGSAAILVPISLVVAGLGYSNGKRFWILAPILVLLTIGLSPMGLSLIRYALELTRLGKSVGNHEWTSQFPFHFNFPFARPAQLDLHLNVPSLIQLASFAFVFWLVQKRRWRLLKRSESALLGLSLFFLLIPFISRRHALFLIASLTAVSVTFWDLVLREKFRAKPFVGGFASIAIALSALSLFRFYQSGFVVPAIEKTSAFMEATQLEGNMFTDPNWGSYLIYRHFPAIRVAHDSRTMVHEAFFRKYRELRDRFGPYAMRFVLEDAPENTDMILISSWYHDAIRKLDPKRWVMVFENNHGTLFLKRNERNQLNFDRLAAYYGRHGVPFDTLSGFIPQKAFTRAPQWYQSVIEKMPWGKWPGKEALEFWRYQQRVYYGSRQIPIFRG